MADRSRPGVGVRAGHLHETGVGLDDPSTGTGLGNCRTYEEIRSIGCTAGNVEEHIGSSGIGPDIETPGDDRGNWIGKRVHRKATPLEVARGCRGTGTPIRLEKTSAEGDIPVHAGLEIEVLLAVGDHASLIDHEVRHLRSGLPTKS